MHSIAARRTVVALALTAFAVAGLSLAASPAFAAAPTISNVNPGKGSQVGGTSVYVNGYNLQGTTVVRFGSTPATITYVSPAGTYVRCVVPASVGQKAVNVTVVTPKGTWTKYSGFTYADPSPTLASLSPASATTGAATTVTLAGTGFLKVGSALPSVSVGNLAGTVTGVTATTVSCTFPDDVVGAKSVTVTNPDGRSVTLASAFTRIAPPTQTDPLPDEGNLDFLPAPLTIRAAGVYLASTGGEARLDMSDVSSGSLTLGGIAYTISADTVKGTLTGTSGIGAQVASRVDLTIKAKNVTSTNGFTATLVTSLTGTRDGQPLTLTRKVAPTISNAELGEFDAGPPAAWLSFFATAPDYAATLKAASVDPTSKMFWYHFGPLFARGRLDGTARVMLIASDPGPTECLPFVRRPLVGDAGQRAQGFLAKLGIDRSYVLVNAYAYAMRPTYVNKNFGRAIIKETFSSVSPVITLTAAQTDEVHKITVFRHELLTRVARSGPIAAIVPMGDNAWTAYQAWIASLPVNDPIRKIPFVKVAHPSAIDRNPMAPRPDVAIQGWRAGITALRKIVAPDPGQTNAVPNYGEYLTENDYVRIPRRDLPWHCPTNVGNNAGTRLVTGEVNDARRPSPDDFKSLIYTDSTDGKKLRYFYQDGVFHPELTTDETGKLVPVGPDGLRTP